VATALSVIVSLCIGTALSLYGFASHTALGQAVRKAAAEEPAQFAAEDPQRLRPGPPLQNVRKGRRQRPEPARPQMDESLWRLLHDYYPEQSRRLERLKKRNPPHFLRTLKRMGPWLRRLQEARKRNPELAETIVEQHRTEMAIAQLRQEWHTARSEEQRNRLGEQLRRLIGRRVELRLQRQRLEIEILEDRLRRLKERLSDQIARKEALIEREWQAALAPGPARRWDPGPGG